MWVLRYQLVGTVLGSQRETAGKLQGPHVSVGAGCRSGDVAQLARGDADLLCRAPCLLAANTTRCKAALSPPTLRVVLFGRRRRRRQRRQQQQQQPHRCFVARSQQARCRARRSPAVTTFAPSLLSCPQRGATVRPAVLLHLAGKV